MKKLIKSILLVLVFAAATTTVFADPPGPPNPGGDPGGSGGVPVGAPIDSNLIVLMGLGTLFGIYRLYENKFSAKEKRELQK